MEWLLWAVTFSASGRVPWNLPERNNFQRNLFLAVLCYLAKCLPVNRGGSREELQRLLDKCRRVLDWRQSLLIFPEGGRSRTGRVNQENFSYGVGRFLDENPNCRVMLVYLRGDGQETYGTMPRFGEHFTMTVEVFDPGRVDGGGLAPPAGICAADRRASGRHGGGVLCRAWVTMSSI